MILMIIFAWAVGILQGGLLVAWHLNGVMLKQKADYLNYCKEHGEFEKEAIKLAKWSQEAIKTLRTNNPYYSSPPNQITYKN